MITPNEFDTLVRDTLQAVDARTPDDPATADRLIANARDGVIKVVPLRHRPGWIAPLLAAAAVAAVALALVLVNNRGGGRVPPAQQTPTPAVTRSAPVTPPTPVSRSTPTPQPPARELVTTSVSYLDAQHGWAIGDDRCPTSAHTDCAKLLRTVDGGRTWHRVHLPAHLVSTRSEGSCGSNGTATGPCVDDVVFATAKVGYLWSYRAFYMTTDGGVHWTNPATQRVIDVVVVGNTAVRMVTLHPCSDGCQYGVFAAPIGTSGWKKVIPYSSGGASAWQLGGGGGVGYVLEQKPSDTFSPASQDLYRSTDGTHWTKVTTAWPCGKNAIDTIRVDASGSLGATCMR